MNEEGKFKIELTIPELFYMDYSSDKFEDSLRRILVDIQNYNLRGISGHYEEETLKMLIDALIDSREVK